jgi:hypothetical protein
MQRNNQTANTEIPSWKLTLSELEEILKKMQGDGTALTEEEYLNQEKYNANLQKLKNRILIIKLSDIANDDYWNRMDQKAFHTIIEQYRDILNDEETRDQTKVRLIKEVNDKLQPKSLSKLDQLTKNALIANENGALYNLQNKINPLHDDDKSSLELLKKIVDDKIYWADKGIENNKIDDNDPDDFTPKLILKYRAILSTNMTTQTDKIKAIRAVSNQLLTKNTKYKDENKFSLCQTVLDILNPDKELPERSSKYMQLDGLKGEISKTHTIQEKTYSILFNKLKSIIDDHNWNDKGFSFSGIPEGILKCREAF